MYEYRDDGLYIDGHKWSTMAAFRSVIHSKDEVDAGFQANMLMALGHNRYRVLQFYTNLGINLIFCEWNQRIMPGTGSLEVRSQLVSSEALVTHGRVCYVCLKVCHVMATRRFSRGHSEHLICSDCTGQGTVVWSYRTQTYWYTGDTDRPNFFGEDEEDDDDDDDDDDLLSHEYDVTKVYPDRFLHTPAEFEGGETLYLGVELEVEADSSFRKAALFAKKVLAGYAILKSDGSLDDELGFEIVSVPATKDVHVPSRRNQYQSFWNTFFDGASDLMNSWYGTDHRCGMHVHLSRRAISHFTLGRMLVFVNERKNLDFICQVAGRAPNKYHDYYPKKILPRGTQYGWNGGGRYEAINLTNLHTYELRIFRGNLSKPGFMKNIEFSHALVMFCREASMRQLESKHFIQWMGEPVQRAEYPFLTAWMVRQKMLGGNTVRFQGNQSQIFVAV